MAALREIQPTRDRDEVVDVAPRAAVKIFVGRRRRSRDRRAASPSLARSSPHGVDLRLDVLRHRVTWSGADARPRSVAASRHRRTSGDPRRGRRVRTTRASDRAIENFTLRTRSGLSARLLEVHFDAADALDALRRGGLAESRRCRRRVRQHRARRGIGDRRTIDTMRKGRVADVNGATLEVRKGGGRPRPRLPEQGVAVGVVFARERRPRRGRGGPRIDASERVMWRTLSREGVFAASGMPRRPELERSLFTVARPCGLHRLR